VPLPYRDPVTRGPLDWRRWEPVDVITAAIAIVVWRLFFPGLMSTDSVSQYGQALTGSYTDWHPPLMAIVLHFVFSAGGGIGMLMLAQCLAGAFGVRALAREAIVAALPDRLPARRIEWLALCVLVVLVLPPFPLAFYLMTFWKDAWAAVLLVWLGATILRLGRAGPSPRRLAAAVGLSLGLALVRHNAIVALPFVGLGLAHALPPPRRWAAFALAISPLALFPLANTALERAFAVQKARVDSAIMVLDLVGLCNVGPEICHRLPWTESHIRDPAAASQYRPGDMGVVFWRPIPPVDLSMRSDYGRLRAEYLYAIRHFPLPLARLHLQGWVALLGLSNTYYYVHSSIVDNPYRLALNGRFAAPREALVSLTLAAAQHPVARWIGGVHLVWLVADVAGSALLLLIGWRSRQPGLVRLGLVLLAPLGYYLSYLLAAPVEDFRFMYPATLFVQCVAFAVALGAVLQKPMGRAP
jgi:hypothetical protein